MIMETQPSDVSSSTTDAELEQPQQQEQQDAVVPDDVDAPNHKSKESSKPENADGEVRGILEVIASTGRFWHDWDKLKSMLSYQLKQVLSEYPDTEMTSEQQNAALGETYVELVKRLDEALHGFTEGPPFTLQRLCEILLDARGIYPNLSKLALALEKNLLVTSMLTISTGPYSKSVLQKTDEPEKAIEKLELHSESVQNGVETVEPMVGDKDEVMVEVEQTDMDDEMAVAMEAFEDTVPSEPNNSWVFK